jgi:hypothetical protein
VVIDQFEELFLRNLTKQSLEPFKSLLWLWLRIMLFEKKKENGRGAGAA